MSHKQTVNIRSRNKDVIIALNQLIYLVLFRINYNPIMIWETIFNSRWKALQYWNMRYITKVCRYQKNQIIFLNHISTGHGVIPVGEWLKGKIHRLKLL